jgi:UDP-N-acetylglucosamine--N-acetylmuramyl-(pentapeptide) pyrophosphoryl-undecaprenol N-acetylglucosamine transferase
VTTTYLFAGGGTGGHIFPALAIAEQLARLDPGCRCHFIISERPIDRRILEPRALAFHPIPARPFGLRPVVLASFVAHWGQAVRATRAVIREARAAGPARMIALGGFVAAPAAQAARVERVPLTLVNLDAAPGKANRWIALHSRRVFTAARAPSFESRGWVWVRPIVRTEAIAPWSAPECRRHFGLDPDRPVLLVTGASQGAASLNHLALSLARAHTRSWKQAGWQVIHQTGQGSAQNVAAAYRQLGVDAVVREFIDPMGPAWGAATLALSRAGAGSVAEVWANRVPTLFLPYPWHRDRHQRRNVEPLLSVGACAVEEDLVDPERNLGRGGAALWSLMLDDHRRARMRIALEGLGPADGAQTVAHAVATDA